MSNKGLSYELGVSYAQALKEGEAFSKKLKTMLEKEFTVNMNLKSSGRGSGSGGRGKGMSDEEKEQKRYLDQLERDSERAEKIYRDMVAKMKLEETRLGKALINERMATVNKLQDLLETGGRLSPDKYRRQANQLVSEYTQQIKMGDAERRAVKADQDDRIRNEQMMGNRLHDIRQNALSRIEAIEIRSGLNLATIRQQAEQRIEAIIQNAGNKRTADVQREVQRELTIYRKAARDMQMVQAAMRQQKGGMFSNKSVGGLFQIQQAVEDFQYAGLRGAGNNIALLASSIGGPAGIIALLGIMGATLGPVVYKLAGFRSEVDANSDALERLKGQLSDTRAFDSSAWWNSRALETSASDLEKLQSKMDDFKRSMGDSRMKESSNNSMISMLERYSELSQMIGNAKTRAAFYQSGPAGLLGFGRDDVVLGQDFIGMFAEMRDLQQQLAQIDPTVNWEKLGSDDLPTVLKILEELQGKNKELVDMRKEDEEILKRMTEEIRRQNELVKKQAEIERKLGLRPGEKFSWSEYESTTLEDSATKRRLAEIKREMKRLEDEINDTKARGVDKTDNLRLITDLAKEAKTLENAAEALKDAEKEALSIAKDKLRTQEQLNKEKDREIEKHEENIKQMKKELEQQRLGYADSGFDTLRSMSGNRNNYYAEQAKKAMGLHLSPNQDYVNMWSDYIDTYFGKVTEYETKFLINAQEKFLSKQAAIAGKNGDFEQQRSLLESIQQMQFQQAASATNPYEAQQWFQKAQQTQKQIEATYAAQKQHEKDQIANLQKQIKNVDDLKNKVKELEAAVLNVPELDIKDPLLIPWLDEVAERLKRLRALGGALGGKGPWDKFNGPAEPDHPSPFSQTGTYQPTALHYPETPNQNESWHLINPQGSYSYGDMRWLLNEAGSGAEWIDWKDVNARAFGGPISAGRPYLVGERGPEMIIPQNAGHVLDAKLTASMLKGMRGGPTSNQVAYNGPITINASTVGTSLEEMDKELRMKMVSDKIRQGR